MTKKINEQWNLDLIYADTARVKKGLFGKGIKIAVLDSGLDTTNTDLKQANIMRKVIIALQMQMM